MAVCRRCPLGVGLLPLGVLLCCVVRCVTDAGDVESARCRVRCLAHLKHKLGGNGDNQITFENCFRDDACTACLRPCGQPFISLGHCIQLCQENEEDCEQSCQFLKHLRTIRPGVCPSPYEVRVFTSACDPECDMDGDCDGLHKCCTNGCAHVCQMPQQLYIGVPEIPRIPKIRERESTGVVELSWRPVVSNNSAPILYMVQSRYNVGHHHSEHHMTQWTQITQTTDTSIIVRDMGPGRWYSFRVGAISVNGTRGFSPMTEPYKLHKEPLPPGAPQNLTEGDTKFEDGRLTVKVHWDPPRKSDLPVARYKIYWVKRVTDPNEDDFETPREIKRVVPGDELEYELDDLKEDTEYLVQVQAISAYGDLRLKSERCSMYLLTKGLQENPQNEGPPSVVEIQALVTLPALRNITVHPLYFYNGQLKANVTWELPEGYSPVPNKVIIQWIAQVCIADDSATSLSQPLSATTHESFFIIYSLRFDCRYNVKLQMTNTDGEVGEVTQLSFASPSCDTVLIIGPVKPDCPNSDPQPPEAPPSLTHSFLIIQTNITAKLMWGRPSSDVEISSYRLVWGQTTQEQEQLHPVLNQDTALTKVLSKDIHTFHMGNLLEATSYMARLQALSPAGSGKTAEIHFRTPVVQQQQADPPYKTDGQGDRRVRQGQGHSHDTTLHPLPSSALPVPYGVERQNTSAASEISQSLLWTVLTASLLIPVFLRLPCR